MPTPEKDLQYFGFTDLHGFKDFLVEVTYGAPDDFMEMDWLKPEEQMTLDRAFVGLRYGLELAEREVGKTSDIDRCSQLVSEAHAAYTSGRNTDGRLKLEEVDRIL